jgi:hypothetical protein
VSTDKNWGDVGLFPDSKQENKIYILLADLENGGSSETVEADHTADHG